MRIPFFYSARNLKARRLTTALTAAGIALVVYVFASVLMMAYGLDRTLVETGSVRNAVVLRKGADAEVQSAIERRAASIVETQPEVATGPDGFPEAAPELVVLISLPKRNTGRLANVIVRGISSRSLSMRSDIRLVAGRLPRSGSSEIAAGREIADRFQGFHVGGTVRFGVREWTVVGILDSDGRAFDSEIWGDVEQLMATFRRDSFSVVVLRMTKASDLGALKARLETDPRLMLDVKRERTFYGDQSQLMANFIRILGLLITALFSLGATIGAMITMYAAVAGRTREIGTLRALGFGRRDILSAFLVESVLLGLVGGGVGILLASLMQFLTISTTNWQSFSELAFRFTLSPAIVAESLAFAAAMGILGGFLPAVRASRTEIVTALRAA